jgi:RNA polymerase sigma factor (sigma-70 family)
MRCSYKGKEDHMASTSLQRTLDRLRIVLAPELPDEFLLKKFISLRDEIAFATLVRRHGRMVLNVARRVVGNPHDSEDVLQATFLVLAQKARLVANRDALASWLYRVAYRISLKAKARNDRRRLVEKQVDVMAHFPTPRPQARDWETVLDEEINRLPEKYRLPIILCDLEGRSRKEVEQQLQVPAGTLSSRLATAKRMLADRLTRRGVVLAGGALWAAAPEATAALPATLVAATAHNAVLVAAGQLGAISGSVSVLMKAGVKAMFIAKLKATVATLMVIASLGAVGLVYSGGDGTPSGSAKPPSELEKLRKENELLKVNLRVTLEKIQTLENDLRAFKGLRAADLEIVRRATGAGARPDNVRAQPSGEHLLLPLSDDGIGTGRPPASGKSQPPLQPSGDALDQRLPKPDPKPGSSQGGKAPPRDESGAAGLSLDNNDGALPNNGRRGGRGRSQPPTDKNALGTASPDTLDTPRLSTGDLDVERDDSLHALRVLTGALSKQLNDQSRAVDKESLRRAIQTLQQLLKQLGDGDAKRP